MAKDNVSQWDQTAAGNTDIGGIAITGGSPVLNFDDALRLLMAQVASFIGTPQLAQENLGSGFLSGFRNVIRNPLGSINQRAVSGTVTLAAGAYGHDGFKGGSSGCTYTFSTTNGVTTFTISAGSLLQTIEASFFAGRSGDYYLSWTGTAEGRINSGSYGDTGEVSATCTGSANVNVEWNTGTMSLPQFERGFVSSFSTRSAAEEWVLCRRYYRSLEAPPLMGYVLTGTGPVMTMPVGEAMRAVPTLAVVSNINILDGAGSSGTINGIGTNLTTKDAVRFVPTLASGSFPTAGRPVAVNASGAGVLSLSAEL